MLDVGLEIHALKVRTTHLLTSVLRLIRGCPRVQMLDKGVQVRARDYAVSIGVEILEALLDVAWCVGVNSTALVFLASVVF